MRLRHWVVLGFIAVGVLFIFHLFTSHGGTQGFISGLGLGGSSGGNGNVTSMRRAG